MQIERGRPHPNPKAGLSNSARQAFLITCVIPTTGGISLNRAGLRFFLRFAPSE
ncbi:MAG: hypothetical protein II645_00305 [Bacteroidaceae bacterium]|nr:hypothetical protein [Bacteroidaceae bacterium]